MLEFIVGIGIGLVILFISIGIVLENMLESIQYEIKIALAELQKIENRIHTLE